MTANEIAAELKNKGFDAVESAGFVIASLGRAISTLEVFHALNGSIEQEHMGKAGNKVVILGQEK